MGSALASRHGDWDSMFIVYECPCGIGPQMFLSYLQHFRFLSYTLPAFFTHVVDNSSFRLIPFNLLHIMSGSGITFSFCATEFVYWWTVLLVNFAYNHSGDAMIG